VSVSSPLSAGKDRVRAVGELAEHAARLVRLELELRLLELRRTLVELGLGAALGVRALLLSPVALAFLFAAAAAALATVVATWLAILIVAAVLLAAVAALAGAAVVLSRAALRGGSDGG